MLTRLIYTLMVLWLTAVACATPTTPEAIIETAVPPTHTPQPTATTAPTATPEPTATPTAEEQANQLLLADGRFTTLLAELTQEIGRGLSDAEQAQVLALARALWLPGQLDESDWLPDPAGVTLHWWPALDGREGPVFLVGEEAQADSPYAAGAVIFWQGERLLGLTPGGVGYYFEFGRIQQNGWDFDTWVEYDAEGNIVSFVHPETMQYVTRESEDWSIFTLSDLDPQGNRVSSGLYWENDGTLIEITTGPGNVPIAGFLADNPDLRLTQTEQNGQQMVALEDAETLELRYTLNPATMQWSEAQPPEQPTLTERHFNISTPLTFLALNSLGLAWGEYPPGVDRQLADSITLSQIDQAAQTINFPISKGCSSEIGYAEPGYFGSIAVIIGHDSFTREFSWGDTTTYQGFWLLTCGRGINNERIPIIFFAPFHAEPAPGDPPFDPRSENHHLFHNWDQQNGKSTDTRIPINSLRNNPQNYYGRVVVLSRQLK
jgi:hypothetical protein